jgi:multidomain signaling protein FimX
MQKQKQLNLLIIDDNQLYAEHLVGLLEKHYYKQVNLGFLDAKDELIKLLRQSWDIILMGNAYDLSFKDVKEILKAHDAHIPVIALLPDDATDYPEALTANEQAQTQLVCHLVAETRHQ